MNAPVVWIIIPGTFAVFLFFLRNKEKLVVGVGVSVSLILGILAALQPIDRSYDLGLLTITLSDTLTFLGRRFVIEPSKAPVLVLIYIGAAFWFGGSLTARTGRLFVPIGLFIVGLVTAALAVRPFLYAAMLIELVVILSIPLFTYNRRSIDAGSLRFLIYLSMSVPFLLFTGWLLTGTEVSPGDPELVLRVGIFLGLGFSLLLGIFPFHTWIPMISENVNLYSVAFVLYLLPLVVTLFGLGFLDNYVWLRTLPGVYALLQWTGLLMVALGGVGELYERNLGRMLAYAMIIEIGITLIVISTGNAETGTIRLLRVFFISLLPRGFALGIWSLAIVTMCRHECQGKDTHKFLILDNLYGAGVRMPIAASALILSQLTLAGFPLTAGFPARIVLWEGLNNQILLLSLGAIFGSVGILAGVVRTILVMVTKSGEESWRLSETWDERIMLMVGSMALLLLGLFPQLWLQQFSQLITIFTNIGN